jgi:GxxExxY protein
LRGEWPSRGWPQKTQKGTKKWEGGGMERSINELCDVVRQTSFDIQAYHRNGHLEKVYENALVIELRNIGLGVIQQSPIRVHYSDQLVGEYYADLLVEDAVIVELKAVRELVEDFEAQLLNYLKATHYEVGLLLNFGPKPKIIRKAYDNRRKGTRSWASRTS